MLGRELPIERRPHRVADVHATQSAPELLRDLFPGVPETALRDGLAATLDWFLAQGPVGVDVTEARRSARLAAIGSGC